MPPMNLRGLFSSQAAPVLPLCRTHRTELLSCQSERIDLRHFFHMRLCTVITLCVFIFNNK